MGEEDPDVDASRALVTSWGTALIFELFVWPYMVAVLDSICNVRKGALLALISTWHQKYRNFNASI
jgi:hypothetical protein